MPYIAAGAAAIILFMGYLMNVLYEDVRAADKANANLETAVALQKQDALNKVVIAGAVEEVVTKYEGKVTAFEKEIKDRDNEDFKRAIMAQAKAENAPFEFDDELIRTFYYYDCLYSSGRGQSDSSVRTTCNTQAGMADTGAASMGIATVTAETRANWAEACDDYAYIGFKPESKDLEGATEDLDITLESWREEYPNFDKRLCSEGFVIVTPKFTSEVNRLLSNGDKWMTRMSIFAQGNRDQLDVVLKPLPKPEEVK